MTEAESPERFVFRSSRGRAELNPYVEKVKEYAPWTLTAEDAERNRGRWRQEIGLADDAPLILEIGPGNVRVHYVGMHKPAAGTKQRSMAGGNAINIMSVRPSWRRCWNFGNHTLRWRRPEWIPRSSCSSCR